MVLKVRVPNKVPFVATISEPTPLIYAILCEQVEVVLVLITQFKASLDISISNWFPVHFAAAVSNYHILLNLVRINNPEIEVARVCDDLSTPLHVAVTSGNAENALLLLHLGANPDAKNRDGNTPLHFCTKLGNLEMAKILLAGGAKLRIENCNKHTPLYTSKLYNRSEMYSYLSGIIKKTIKRLTIKDLLRTSAYSDLSFLLLDSEEEEEESPKEPEPPKKAAVPKSKQKRKPEPVCTDEDAEEPVIDQNVLESIYNQLKSCEERLNRLQCVDGSSSDETPMTISAITSKIENLVARTEDCTLTPDEDLSGCGAMCELCGTMNNICLCSQCGHIYCVVCSGSLEHLDLHLRL